jgi:enoyl-CoA hydratase
MVLTGARLATADCELLGLATDVVAAERLPEIKAAIVREPEAIERILTEFEVDPGRAPIAAWRDDIDRLFAGDSVEAIVAALEADGSDWARGQLEAMRPKSPISLKVSFRLLAGSHPATIADDFVTEYRIARRQVMTHDFTEGVRAVIVDKDNKPAWSPDTLEGVSEAMVDAIFAALPADEEWTPLPGL